MNKFLRTRYSLLKTYTPGEQPRDMQYTKLNTNESPYPPSPGALEAARSEAERFHLYPDPECAVLKEKLAGRFDVMPQNVFVSNGSDEILSFAFMAFCGGERETVFPSVTYGFYKVYGDLYGVKYTEIPLRDDFTINVEDYIGIDKNIVIANPNAPTGISLSVEDIEKILRTNPQNLVIIDEAYVDFGARSCIPLVKKYDNLLVAQTFSKSRSLAGGRLGFAIASEEIIAGLEKIKYSTNPYNVNRVTQAAGAAALDDEGYFARCCGEIIKTRQYTGQELLKRGFVVTNSEANFLFARHSGISGAELYEKLKEYGILVRHFSQEEIKEFVRITVGTVQQTDLLVYTIDKILTERGVL